MTDSTLAPAGTVAEGLGEIRLREIRLREIGAAVTPETIQATWELFRPAHDGLESAPHRVVRDLHYGPDARHRLDVRMPATPGDATADRPVLLFVHGGGFVGGDKTVPGMPYYDHVAQWAVSHDWVGVTMTYRLAPAHRWPAGADDVAAAVAWVAENIAGYGGDPSRIAVMGHSAGAAHVASYLAAQAGSPRSEQVACAVLASGVYDLMTAERNDVLRAYFGDDVDRYPRMSALEGLLDSAVPTLFTVAELDPPDFQSQAAGVVAAFHARHGRVPPLVWVAGHTHLSEIAHLGTADAAMGDAIARFVRRSTGVPGAENAR